MDTVVIPIKNRKQWLETRLKFITSTDAPALFNKSPYTSEFELFHTKKNKQVIELEENERMKWGSALEGAIGAQIAKDNNWDAKPMKDFMHLKEHRVGSSFDFFVGKKGVLEIKNVDRMAFNSQWIQGDGVVVPPTHILIQAQVELLVSQRDFLNLGVLVGGNELHLIPVQPKPNFLEAVVLKTDEFWERVEKGKAPTPDFERDAKYIISLYNKASSEKVLDASENKEICDLVKDYNALSREISKLEKIKTATKAKLLVEIGDAEKAFSDWFTISAGEVPEGKVESYIRKPYRSFRVNLKNKGLLEK